MNPRFRHLYLLWGMAENLLFSGILYGWVALVFVLKDESMYANLCTNHTFSSGNITIQHNSSQILGIDCPSQNEMLALVMTLGSAIWPIALGVIGQVNYKFGIRISRLICSALVISGGLMLAFLTTDLPWLMFPGAILMGIGCLNIGILNIQISNLYNKAKSKVVLLLAGCIDSSAVVMVFIKVAYENGGISRRNSFLFLTGAHLLPILHTVFFSPRYMIPEKKKSLGENEQEQDASKVTKLDELKPVADVSYIEVKPLSEQNGVHDVPKYLALPNEYKEKDIDAVPSLKTSLCSRIYVVHVLWLCVHVTKFNFFLISTNVWLSRICDNDINKVSYYTDVSTYALFCGAIFSIIAGVVYDSRQKVYRDDPSPTRRRMMPAVLPLAITSAVGLLHGVLVLIPYEEALYVTFVVFAVYRANIYGISYTYILQMFPVKYYSSMSGVMLAVAGIFSAIQYPLFIWFNSSEMGAIYVRVLMLFLVTLTYINPIYILSVAGNFNFCVKKKAYKLDK